ncbi:MAG: transposase [Acidobacteria bacterium]|nr:transposase [Acidobacteriota bacterium]
MGRPLQAPFGGPAQVLDYLARYTHRVALSNDRLVQLQDGKVTFRWRDYRYGSRLRLMTLDADEFIRRFLLPAAAPAFPQSRDTRLPQLPDPDARLSPPVIESP